MIAIKHLQILASVIRLGSVTAAAQEQNVSQPTASKAIRRLEDIAGTHLFERLEGRLRPTSEALVLAREAEHLVSEWISYQRLITNISQQTGDRLHVASAPAYTATIMPRAILEITRAHPNIHVKSEISMPADIVDAAASGRIDVGIVHYTDAEPMATAVPICKARIVCIMPTGHELAKKQIVRAADIHDWPHVGYRRDLPFARQISQQLGANDVGPLVAIEANHSALIRDLVRFGAGIALIDPFTLLFDLPEGLEIRPFEPVIEVTMAVIYARNRPLSRMGKAFVDCLKTVLAGETDRITLVRGV